MRRIISLLAVLLLCGSVNAQVPMTGAGLAKPATGGGGSPTFTGATSGGNGSCGFVTSCSVAGLTVVSGFVVVGVGGSIPGATTDWSTVSACGTPLTKIIGNGNTTTNPTDIWAGTVTGGTCSVTVTHTGNIGSLVVGLGTLNSLSSTTATSTCSGNFPGSAQNSPYSCSTAITVPASGFGVAFAYNQGTTGFGWSNMTVDPSTVNSADQGGISHMATAGSITPQFTGVGFVSSGIAAATWN